MKLKNTWQRATSTPQHRAARSDAPNELQLRRVKLTFATACGARLYEQPTKREDWTDKGDYLGMSRALKVNVPLGASITKVSSKTLANVLHHTVDKVAPQLKTRQAWDDV